MSIFESLTPRQPKSPLFEGLKPLDKQAKTKQQSNKRDAPTNNLDDLPPERKNAILQWAAREILKPVVQGAVGMADLPSSLYNLAGMGIEKTTGTHLPQAPYLADYAGKGVDLATRGYSEGEPGMVGKGVEFGAGMLSGGLAGKSAKVLAQGTKAASAVGKVAPWLGSTELPAIAGAGIIGATAKVLEDRGAFTSTAGGLGAGIGAQAGLMALGKKTMLRTMGLGPKDLKLGAIEAAERQGLELPAWAATDAKAMKLGAQLGSHTPFVGDAMQKQSKKFGESFLESIKRTADKIGPQATSETEKKVNALYERSKKFLPKEAEIVPNNVANTLFNIEEGIAKKGIKSSKTKEVLRDVSEFKTALGLNVFQGERFLPPNSVHSLVETKKELNSIIHWDKKTDLPTKYYKDIREALVKDIEEYGKENPKFLDAFNKANEYRASVGKRETFDEKLLNKIGNEESGVKYSTFARIASDPKQRKILEKTIGKENLRDFEDLTEAAKAMAEAGKVANPSSTAPVKALYGAANKFLSLILTAKIFKVSPTAAAFSIGVPLYAKRILTNPKILKQATKFAKAPSEVYAKRLEKLIKADFGITMEELTKKLEQEK